MTEYTFQASSSTQSAEWDDPSKWVGGVVPNAPDADVNFPLVTDVATGATYLTEVGIQSGESFSVHTIALNDVLDVDGSLTVSSDVSANAGSLNVAGNLTINGTLSDQNGFTAQVLTGGTLSAQTINTGPGQIYGGGQVIAGTLNNAGTVDAATSNATTVNNSGTLGGYSSSTVTADTLTNTGTVYAVNASTTTINVAPGGFTNLVGGTLTGGTYADEGAGAQIVINAGEAVTTDAANITLQQGISSFTSYDPVSGQYVALNDSLHTIASGGTLSFDGDASFGALTVAGTLEIDGTQLSSSNLVVAPGGLLESDGNPSTINASIENDGVVGPLYSTMTINGDVTGTGHLEVMNSGTLELNGATAQTVVIDESPGGRFSIPGELQINNPGTFTGSVAPSGHGDKIYLPNISSTSVTGYTYVGDANGGTLTLQEQGGGTSFVSIQGNFTAGDFHVGPGPQILSTDPTGTLITVGTAPPVCFLAGTRILTPGGETAVERLRVGDTIVTLSGAVKPIIWIGSGGASADVGSRAVVVRAGALSEGVPARDLRLTEGHSLFLDGVLIPAAILINGRSIAWDLDADVRFYHVELADHDILVADGAPAESYRDDGNRSSFDRTVGAAHGEKKRPCAPVLTEGPRVDAIWARIVGRTGAPRPLVDDADLHLLVDGQRLDPISIEDGQYHFVSPRGGGSITIGSRAVVPSHVGTTRDHRRLGVALRHITAAGAGGAISLDYASDLLKEGYHEAEHGDRLRWTNGAAKIPLGPLAGVGAFSVELKIACFAQYAA